MVSLCQSFLKKIAKNTEKADFIKKVHSESFNLGFEENPNLDDFIRLMGKHMGIPQVRFIHQNDLDGFGKYFFPSVECGHISIEKAKNLIEWKPSRIEEAMEDIV